MDYGLYLSASGIVAAGYRQDVIANNLANSETVGFKRNLAIFQQRLTETQSRGFSSSRSNRSLEPLGGGLLASPTVTDFNAGDLEAGSSPQDAAIVGKGFFGVEQDGKTLLTRDGRLSVDSEGYLHLTDSSGPKVLGPDSRPIHLDSTAPFSIGNNGEIHQKGQVVGQLGLFTVPDQQRLKKLGGNLYDYPDATAITPTEGTIKGGMIERSNVEPSVELSSMMETQRILEANANMIRYQDQMLSRLCTDVGKIS